MRLQTWQATLLVVAGAALGLLLPRLVTDAGAGERDDEVLARVGGAALTRSEVERTQAKPFLDLDRQRHALTEQTLVQAVRIKLVETEAEARGMSPSDLVDQEVFGRVEGPTQEEIEAYYRERRPPVPLEQATSQIRSTLRAQEQSERYEAFLSELRARHSVENFLEPFRTDVVSAGHPAKGPDDAPVTIVEFADFQCPYCFELLDAVDQVTSAFGDRVRFVYRQFPIEALHPEAMKAAEASLCADDQDRFWDMHDAMFADQDRLGVAALKEIARMLDLDGEAFDECLDSGRHAAAVQADLRAGREAGVGGTPALFINGRFLGGIQTAQTIADIVSDELDRLGISHETGRMEPRRIAVASEGFPSKGPADAPVTIVEFADFQCPYCYQLLGALERVDAVYGDQVRFVYRQFPIPAIHPDAQKSAEASLCANEQGRFWEMHDAMFADQAALGVEDLRNTARRIGLDAGEFDSCLASGRHEEGIAADVAEGRRLGVRGTPALFINGRYLAGIQSFETLANLIDDELSRVKER